MSRPVSKTEKPKCIICKSDGESYFIYKRKDSLECEKSAEYQIWRCKECALIFVFPFPDLSIINAQYETESKKEHLRSGSYLGRKLRYGWRALKLRSSGMHGSMLEIGCGQGDFLIGARFAKFHPVVGVEPQNHVAEFARNRGFVVHGNTFNPGDFEPEEFDNVASIQVIEHVPDPIKFVEDIALVIKKNGRILIETPCTSHPRAVKSGKDWRYICPPWHLYLFNERNIEILFDLTGFKLEKFWKQTHKAYISAIGRKL